LINQLTENSKRGEPLDMLQWFMWTTFDIVGDLAFGESFGCLESQRGHPWVQTMLDGFAAGMLISTIRRYLPLELAMRMVPRKLMDQRVAHHEFAKGTVRRRMQRGAGHRPDFIAYIFRHNNDEDTKGLMVTPAEVQPNAAFLVLAGGETTCTLLSGTLFFLLENPRTLTRLVTELRQLFDSPEAITFTALSNKLPYLLAVFDEGLRLYPPVATGLPRFTPVEGTFVDGRFVPGNVSLW
jgi:cytochrome P450